MNVSSIKKMFTKKDGIYCSILFLLLFISFLYGITKIAGFSIFPDEFGYWASAANKIGWDWSEIASLGSYYSFGYSFILFPILLIFENSVLAYQAAVFFNVLFMGVGYVLLYKISDSYLEIRNKSEARFLCMIAIFYPSWIFYMQMTLAEALLMFLFIMVFFFFVMTLERKTPIYSIGLAIFTGYLYAVHMRSIGVVIACAMVMFFLLLKEKQYRKTTICFWGTIVLCVVVLFVMKNNTIQEVYTKVDTKLLAINDYSSKWWIWKELVTVSGMIDFLGGLLGKVFYLGCASFGIFYWTMLALGKQVFGLFVHLFHKEEIRKEEWLGTFLFLAVIGEVLICALAMYRPGYIDGVVYGRYSEFVMPLLLLVGVRQMQKIRHLFLKCTLLAGLTGGAVPILVKMIQANKLERIRGYHAVGLSYMLQDEYESAAGYLTKSWLFFAVGTLFIAGIICLSRHKKHLEWLLCCVVLWEFALGIQASNHYVYTSNITNHMDLVITNTIKENIKEKESVYFVNDNRTPYIDFLQMQLREQSISVIEKEKIAEKIKQADYLILYRDMEDGFDYEAYFSKWVISNQYILYYEKSGMEQ